MEAPAMNAGFLPVIKCSDCGDDIDMAAMADHQCANFKSSASASRPPPPPRADSSNGSKSLRSQRPLLPRIDPSAEFRPPVFQGELTPASSQHSSLVSPVSTSSRSRSPWPPNRKGSIPGPRRPPSPELTNLDCAFPPFPMPSKAPTTRRRDRSTTQGSETQRSRSRNAPRPPRQDSRPNPLARAASSQNLAENTGYKPKDVKSRPTSPSTTSSQSTSNKSASRQQSADNAPEMQGFWPPERQALIHSPSEGEVAVGTAASHRLLTSHTEPQPAQDVQSDHPPSSFDSSDRVKSGSETSQAFFIPMPLEAKLKAEPEPAYKSKRPPPLVREQLPAITKLRSPTTPQPLSAGVLSKGFGRLFGRRRSQSMNSRREVVRQALSDEPDVYEDQGSGQSILSARSDRSFLTAEPSPLSTASAPSPALLPSHEESLKALEGIAPAPNPAPIVLVEPSSGEEPFPPAPLFQRLVESPEAHHPIATIREPEQQAGEANESLPRTSIDSASSYASVGFSEHATSSRSSSPHTESLALKSFDSSVSNLLQPLTADMPAPLRPGRVQTTPDSPTDPLFQQGRLSPIPDPPRELHGSTPVLQPSPVESPISPASIPEPNVAVNLKGKSATPNKGVCRGCSRIILATQKSVSSADGRLTGRYHKECFVCRTCRSAFPTAEFYVHNDHPYCGYHYHELENSLCASCGKGIEGLYMETTNVAGRGKEKHHPECLKCATCKIRLDHDYFELSGKVYCERDAFRMASMPKSRDNAPSRPSPLIREYISSGDHGLLKGRNFPERRTTRLMSMT